MGIDLVELETFIAVAEAGSFSVAAQRLHVTQPTVTGRIQRLEGTLGTRLLQRTTRKVEATPQGALLLAEARQALGNLRQLVRGFRKKAREARQRVVVAATPTVAAVRLPAIIQDYCERFPDVEIELRDLPHPEVLAAIDEGSADLGVLAYGGEDPRYVFEPLWQDDMLLVAPKNHPLASYRKVGPRELAGHTFIIVGQHQHLRTKIAEAMERIDLRLPPSRVVANLNTLVGMLDAGMGVTLIPRSISHRADVARHSLIEIEGIDLRRNFGIVLSSRARLNAAGQSFCRFLTQIIRPQ